MQLKDPVYTSCVHLRKFMVHRAVVVLAVSLSQFDSSTTAMLAVTVSWRGYNNRANDSDSNMKAASRKWSPRPADCSNTLATLRERRQEASRMKWKDGCSEVTTPCDFGTR